MSDARPVVGGLLARLDPLRLQSEQIRRDFYRFVREGWHIIEPGKSFRDNWHIGAIVEHLTAVTFLDIRFLVINIPPRCSKSTLVSVMWPAWVWTVIPETQWLCASYGLHLSSRDSVKCRRLIESPWYQQRFGDTFRITSDQNTKLKFENDKTGYRLATSVGGTTTGEGGDIIVIDDAHNATEVESDVKRASTLEWWDNAMSTRGNDPLTVRNVIMAQRVHHQDICGHALKQGGWEHLRLPMEFVPEKRCVTSIGFEDPRTEPGELLDKKRFPKAEVQRLKSRLTRYAAAAQLQQDPTPDEGGILMKKDWKLWPSSELPEIELTFAVYDTAFETNQDADFCARTTWGVFSKTFQLENGREISRYCVILLERLNKRMTFPQLREEAMKHWNEWSPDRVIVERKASGHSLAQEFDRAGVKVVRFDPGTRDKVARANVAALVLEQGCVYYVDRDWVFDVIDQCARFPNDDHDDLVDTCVMAWMWLRKGLRVEFDKDMEEQEQEMSGSRAAKFRGYGS